MLLKFLGNGSAFNAKKKCNSAYIINGVDMYLFDCGGDIFKEIMNNNLLSGIKNIYIMITHFHPDHCGSLGDLIFYNFFIKKCPLMIYACDNIMPLLQGMGVTNDMYKFILLRSMYETKVDYNMHITMITQNHTNTLKACGYIINFKDKKIFYSGDSNSIPDIVLNNIDSFDEIYQDTCGNDFSGNPHLYFGKLKNLINKQYRNKIYCMHLDGNILEKEITDAGFNVVEQINLNKKIAIYPGSFDPVTKGHLHIISKASKLFDKVIVLVANNSKKKSVFTLEEKIKMLKLSIKEQNVEVISTDDLTVNAANNVHANYIIRGLRNSVDFEYEKTINLVNKKIDKDIETIFLMSDGEYELMSSSAARELLSYHSNVNWILPQEIIDLCKSKY